MNIPSKTFIPAIALCGLLLSGTANADGFEPWAQRSIDLRHSEVAESQVYANDNTVWYLKNSNDIHQKTIDLEKKINMQKAVVSRSAKAFEPWYLQG